MDGTQSTSYPPVSGDQLVALTTLPPPDVPAGPRLNSHSIGARPDSPSVLLRSCNLCSAPHRQRAGSPPSRLVSSVVASLIAAARMSSRVSTVVVPRSSHH